MPGSMQAGDSDGSAGLNKGIKKQGRDQDNKQGTQIRAASALQTEPGHRRL